MFSTTDVSSTPSRLSSAATCADPGAASRSITFTVRDYDLGATLDSGQAFRCPFLDGGWNGVIGNHWVRLRADAFSISAEAAAPVRDWAWLADYLQVHLDL